MTSLDGHPQISREFLVQYGAHRRVAPRRVSLPVLCWRWIDGLRKAFDERSYWQRYTPRRAKSLWSQINRQHVARLTKAG